MSPNAKSQKFGRSCDRLMPRPHDITLFVTELREARAVEFLSVRVYLFVRMDSMDRERNDRVCWNGHATGKCEGA